VEVHPKKLADVRRFMAYYLPTTVKLLDAYREFDRQPIQGENIKNAKKEINDALDTINTAFENLFDSLFEDAAWSVSADITVLNTMLKQEGLTGNDFKHGDGGSNPE
jgi:5-bromo-4-chloroindolyl phosphate hydrolysis protein